ncbi:Thymidylate kinase [Serinicoccus hydrothermalis]|uniref:Thymidylate kinase n=1 Tax=Serinicoccus hydrothermalis TaxID=1758689 RepID=A0A1B1N7K2_9MICO|nr:thioredoxin domain-containing protein [Serinicoccus hydrothermalis]ANS77410.1 Thymidylate kinase [Serinicoccus hydrothermalis]
MPNRLAASTSPYLQQHADNPVDWWEWGADAFEEARRRGIPVLLSVGYAACHWCHVMAHESFEDEEVAQVLREGFVAVKVDREERPDVDAVYMSALTGLTGQGGWPMTCLLTPAGEPFWAGTYLPREGFLQLLRAASAQWAQDRERMEQGGARVVQALTDAQGRAADAERAGSLDAEVVEQAARTLAEEHDPQWGGFGGAPKFPPSMVLAFLLRHHARTGDAGSLSMVRRTCERMARSGTYDQVGGGFARYAVDRAWVVPHFEKMLYDNALLLGVYTDLARTDPASRPWAERVVRETVEWLLRELWTEQEAFASSLDADTDGVEGATYTWTREELVRALGEEDGERAADLLGVTAAGTFEHGRSTLQLAEDPDDPSWWAAARQQLDVLRSLRPQPDRDDKVVTAWNGLLVASLAHAGRVFEEEDWVDLAARCARFLLREHVVDGRLRRSSRDGTVGSALAVAEDYGGLADGLLALHRATGEQQWLDEATDLLGIARTLFVRPDGSVAGTGHDAERLVLDPGTNGDNAEPGGLSAIALALVRLGAQGGLAEQFEVAGKALGHVGGQARQAPRFTGWSLVAAEELLTGPIVVRLGPAVEPALAQAASRTPVGTLVMHSSTDEAAAPPADAALICHGTVCGLPTRDPADLP